MISTSLFIILICILLSAFFSGIEIAFLSSNKLKIELENKQGLFSARILSFFVKKPSHFIAAMLLGNNVALVVYGIYIALILEPPIRDYVWDNRWFVLVVQTFISTLIILFTAEFLPKAIFRINPNGILKVFALPMILIYLILWLPTMIMLGISEGILRIFTGNKKGDGTDVGLGRIDLDNYLEEVTQNAAQSQTEIDHEIQIFRNALDFSKVKIRECMIPRTEIVAANVDSNIDELKQLFIKTQLSKILIYRDNLDNIIGYVHSYELFKQPTRIQDILLPISIVPETQSAQSLLEEFTKQSRSIAIVVDEFGGTSGLVTMEDIIEEIFGEIEDEHDTEELIEKQISEKEFLFSGRMEIDYLNETYSLQIPVNDEYSTLAGYIINQTQDIPEKGTTVQAGAYRFVIESVTGQKIEIIRILPALTD
ncbi:MAG: hemolysin family protein [Flavobacteriales bacterium]|nr:hemolysin family protein [Flavobacteriales bacterium]